MCSLLLKEYYVLRWFVIYYGLVMIFLPDSFDAYFIGWLIWSIKYYEVQNNSEVLINSLPVTRSEVVRSKYLSMIVVALLFVLVAYIGQPIRDLVQYGRVSVDFNMILGLVTGIAIGLPVYFWLGSRVNITLLVTTAFLIPASIGIELALDTVLKSGLGWLVWVLSIMMLWMSYLTSVAIYKRREF